MNRQNTLISEIIDNSRRRGDHVRLRDNFSERREGLLSPGEVDSRISWLLRVNWQRFQCWQGAHGIPVGREEENRRL